MWENPGVVSFFSKGCNVTLVVNTNAPNASSMPSYAGNSACSRYYAVNVVTSTHNVRRFVKRDPDIHGLIIQGP